MGKNCNYIAYLIRVAEIMEVYQGHNFYKLKYISLEEVKIVPFKQ